MTAEFVEADLIATGRALPIRLGAFSSISNSWLPEVIAGYRKHHPDVLFDISVKRTSILMLSPVIRFWNHL